MRPHRTTDTASSKNKALTFVEEGIKAKPYPKKRLAGRPERLVMASVKSITLTAVALGFALAAFPATSRADLYSQTSDHCSGTGGIPTMCGIVAGNTVTVTTTGVANQLQITAQLANNWSFIATGFGASFGFALPQTSLVFTQGSPTFSATGWEPFPGGSTASPQTVSSSTGNTWLSRFGGIPFPANFPE